MFTERHAFYLEHIKDSKNHAAIAFDLAYCRAAIAQPVQLEVRKEIETAVLAEREACAATLDRLYDWSAMSSNYKSGFNWGMQVAADLIRARSQTESIVHQERI